MPWDMWETRGENLSLLREALGEAAEPTAGAEVIHTPLHRGAASTGVTLRAPGP